LRYTSSMSLKGARRFVTVAKDRHKNAFGVRGAANVTHAGHINK